MTHSLGAALPPPAARQAPAADVSEGESLEDIYLAPLIEEAVSAAGSGGWHVAVDGDPASIWTYVEPAGARLPERGWKLHVSATVWSAEEVLRASLPVLLTETVTFKVAQSLRTLDDLNEGIAGVSQVGKFITVYPKDDEQAVRVGVALDAATMGLRGPRVVSDRPLRDGGLVHYRYGDFSPSAPQPAPPSPEDPFVAGGVMAEPKIGLIGGRYLITSTLQQSPRGAVHLGLDVSEVRSCILKRAWHDARAMPDGTDARDQLRHEHDVLEQIGTGEAFPAVFGLVPGEGDLFLVMEHIEGRTLGRAVDRRRRSGDLLALEDLRSIGVQLAAALTQVHRAGLVYRDLGPENVIVGAGDRVRLIDFELAIAAGADTPFYTAGTPGFVAPERLAGERSSPAEDIFGIGALLHFAATGRPVEQRADADPVSALETTTGAALASVIARCLHADPRARWTTMAELLQAITSA